jgi:1-deoxy-D-xylulose-5-phosphate reductoisomerase
MDDPVSPETDADHPIGVAVLGSTGSVGTRTLDVIAHHPDRFRVVALGAGRNHALLDEQVCRFRPAYVSADGEVPQAAAWTGTRVLPLVDLVAQPEVDLVVAGIVGAAGLSSTLAALRLGKPVALANKETLVMAGRVITEAARIGGGSLRPVDSEHSAIWQCLWGERPESIEKIILTASGGAFRDLAPDALSSVTPEQALHHPTWDMGRKITVESATLMNKGLETIEARWLFDVPIERVEVLMHRESIVHSLVEFRDGSVKAQLGQPDMRLPILCALGYPDRLPDTNTPRLDLGRLGALHFAIPEIERYPCLGLAMAAGRQGQTYPAVLAGAGEVAVEGFLGGAIGFLEMAGAVEDALGSHDPTPDDELEAILAADAWARRRAQTWIAGRQ